MIERQPLAAGPHPPGLRADVDDVHVARVDDVQRRVVQHSRPPATTRVQSSGPTRLLRIRSHGTRASAHSRRMPISCRDISRENTATDSPADRHVAAMFMASDDFPIPGRAAMITGCPAAAPK